MLCLLAVYIVCVYLGLVQHTRVGVNYTNIDIYIHKLHKYTYIYVHVHTLKLDQLMKKVFIA